jgi:hypothetical protein
MGIFKRKRQDSDDFSCSIDNGKFLICFSDLFS